MAKKAAVKTTKSAKSTKTTKLPRDRLLPKLTTFFFDRPKITAVIWLVIAIFGILSYTTFLTREGFPSVNIPLTIVNGTYFANDPAAVDQQVANPISQAALKLGDVDTVSTQSSDNFFVIQIQYKDGTDAQAATKQLQQDVAKAGNLPAAAHVQYTVPYFGATGGDTVPIDVAASFYANDQTQSTANLTAKAQQAAVWLNAHKPSTVQNVFVKNPFSNVVNPATGQAVTVQQNFDQFGQRVNNKTSFYNSVIVGFTAVKGADVIKLDQQVRDELTEMAKQPQFSGYNATVSASFAPSIKENISELQRSLLEGLLAILIVGSLVIAIRASFITVISMVTVLVTSLGLLYLIGYTLNVITLFALILGLALIVDDTIIMTEAIDSARRRTHDPREAVETATRKISRAMVAATATAALSFAPLLFVGGILGSFIRAIPVTIISSLIISLLVALIFIPFFARFLLLGKKQMGSKGAVKEAAAGFEAKVAAFIARPMLWARHSRRKLFTVGIIAIVIGFGFITAGLVISRNVVFNIFPPSKDTNGLELAINFKPGTTIQGAQVVALQADQIAAKQLGGNFVQSSYFGSGTAESASEQIQIISYTQRSVTSQQLVKQLQGIYDTQFPQAQVVVGQVDVGPPSSSFVVQIDATNRPAALKAAQDVATYMSTATLTRTNGTKAHFKNVTVSSSGQYLRSNGQPIVTVSASFDANDTTTLVDLAQTSVKSEFTATKMESYGLSKDALTFNLGEESQNQSSFKTLVLAFPILLAVIFVLLAFEFRSLLQPLLIFMAIPFSIFGIMLGLDITNNAISFFALLGFFALVGLSIKNTILLTDYANQARRSGLSVVDSAVEALEERFRPLFATSMTAVVSLIPLALTSPFWQGLAVVLIFGLLSSTLLVVTVFPYYYLGAEYLRLEIGGKNFAKWAIPTVAAMVLVGALIGGAWVAAVIPLSLIFVIIYHNYKKHLA